jgi:hypothetical protein
MQTLISFLKRPNSLVWLVLLLGASAALAQTSSPDVGLVTKLTGEATYRNDEDKKPTRVQAFMKVRKGDHFQIAGAGSLQLLYFASGRQETWKGPAQLKAGDTASAALGGKQQAPPAVKLMPASATKKLAAAPFLLSRGGASFSGATQIKGGAPGRSGATAILEKAPSGRSGVTEMQRVKPGRSGVIQTMAPTCPTPKKAATPAALSEKARGEIKEAKRVYRELKKKVAADDPTPELYLLGVLAQHQQYGQMDKIIDKKLQKKPEDAAFRDLRAWVRAQCNAGN